MQVSWDKCFLCRVANSQAVFIALGILFPDSRLLIKKTTSDMFSKTPSDNTLSLALFVSAAAWGLYWFPLRTIENTGLSGSWSVVFFNACPLIVLCPWLVFNFRKLIGVVGPTLLAAMMIGMAFTLYSNGLVETTIVRATMLFYLTPVWSTLIGVMWLSEHLTKARIIAIGVAFVGLFLLLSDGESSHYPLNIGDLYSFLSGIFWAIGVATLKRWAKIPILPLATFIFVSTTAISALFAGVFYVDPLPDFIMLKAAFHVGSNRRDYQRHHPGSRGNDAVDAMGGCFRHHTGRIYRSDIWLQQKTESRSIRQQLWNRV